MAPSANLLMTPNQEEQLICQRFVLPLRGASVGWRNGLDRNLMQFSKGKGKVPQLGRNKPMHHYMWGPPSSAEKWWTPS